MVNLGKLAKDITSPKNLGIVLAGIAIGWVLHSFLTGTPLLGGTQAAVRQMSPSPLRTPIYQAAPMGRTPIY